MRCTVAEFRASIGRLNPARERTLVVSVAVALVLLRSSAFVFGRAPAFDSDQAIVGLMAKHLSELRALPVFFYGQDFMLGVEAWLAAPLFVVAGPSVTALKLPLLGMHLAITLILLRVFEQELRLRPLLALVPTLFFIAAPLRTSAKLLQANGGNVEPFLYVLLLWLLRRRPLAFGAVLGIGFLNREFTAYGVAAILLIEAAEGVLFERRRLQELLVACVSLAAVFHVVEFLASIGSPSGPGTTAASVNRSLGLQVVAGRSCWDWAGLPQHLATMFTTNMSTLYTNDVGWLWLVLGGTAVGACARVVSELSAGGSARRGGLQFPVYLALVGLIAALVPAVSRCGAMYDRYVLLALFGLAGITALFLKIERRPAPRAAVIAVTLLCATFNAAGHFRYAVNYFRSPVGAHDVLADYLVSNGIRFAKSDYWTAYNVSFLTGEQVIIASDFPRIRYYQEVVAEHEHEAVEIRRRPCDDGHEVEGYHVCPPP